MPEWNVETDVKEEVAENRPKTGLKGGIENCYNGIGFSFDFFFALRDNVVNKMSCFRAEYWLEIWERKLFRPRWMDGNFQVFTTSWTYSLKFFFLIQFSNPRKKKTNLHNKTNYRSIITSSCSKMVPLSKWPFSFSSVEIIMCWVRYLFWLTLIQTSTGWLSIPSCPWARNIKFKFYSWINGLWHWAGGILYSRNSPYDHSRKRPALVKTSVKCD